MKTYFYSGAFDPFTALDAEAVLDILTSDAYSKVIIGLELDSEKTALFPVTKRMKMIEKSLYWYTKAHHRHLLELLPERIKIVSYHGLPIYEAIKHGASWFLIPTDKTKKYDIKFELSRQIARNKLNSQIGYWFHEFNQLPEDIAQAIRLCYKNHEYIMLATYVTPPVHNMLMEDLLEKQYFDCCRQSNISWEDFCAEMSSRAYHNLSHIAYMLDKYDVFKTSITEDIDFATEKNFKAAIFFHDYVADDEEKSFEASGLSESSKGVFMATKYSADMPETEDKYEQLIRDLDLAIFTDKLLYENYIYCIRAEYDHIAHDEYVNARTKVLETIETVIEGQTSFTKEQKKTAFDNIVHETYLLKHSNWFW
ncbi:MAG: hypothetical protein E7016_05275 [Alphaproteobacteria bacterium]|nr:hypothetical protein [Alphaproteobacteria bacterium]